MNILAICCALDNSYIAIKYDDKIISKIIKSDENYHSLYIISEIKKLTENNSIKLKELDAICTNCGPGSFTGIRVALTISKIMASELNKPIIPLNTAEILLDAFNCNIFLSDARRDMFYFGNQKEIKLIYKNKINEELLKLNKSIKIIADKKCCEMFSNTFCYENQNINLGETMIKLAEEKWNNTKDKEIFNCINLTANYIQTPPIN